MRIPVSFAKCPFRPYTQRSESTKMANKNVTTSCHLTRCLAFWPACNLSLKLTPPSTLLRYRSSLSHLLPDYGCLILSPANIWRKASSLFQGDGNIVDTVFQLQRSRQGHSSLADILFGLRQRDTGVRIHFPTFT